jgi:hypothetical protein
MGLMGVFCNPQTGGTVYTNPITPPAYPARHQMLTHVRTSHTHAVYRLVAAHVPPSLQCPVAPGAAPTHPPSSTAAACLSSCSNKTAPVDRSRASWGCRRVRGRQHSALVTPTSTCDPGSNQHTQGCQAPVQRVSAVARAQGPAAAVPHDGVLSTPHAFTRAPASHLVLTT